jgi:hypothetical protein
MSLCRGLTCIGLTPAGATMRHALQHHQRILNALPRRLLRELANKADAASIAVVLGVEQTGRLRDGAVRVAQDQTAAQTRANRNPSRLNSVPGPTSSGTTASYCPSDAGGCDPAWSLRQDGRHTLLPLLSPSSKVVASLRPWQSQRPHRLGHGRWIGCRSECRNGAKALIAAWKYHTPNKIILSAT